MNDFGFQTHAGLGVSDPVAMLFGHTTSNSPFCHWLTEPGVATFSLPLNLILPTTVSCVLLATKSRIALRSSPTLPTAEVSISRLAQQARKQAPQLPIGASEWAATEQLVELGGDVVEGLLIVQNYDHEDNSPRFREFSEAYFKRFQRSPGYSSVSAYDAATVVLDALRKRQGGETLKDALLKNSPYQGLQQEIAFDANGDTPRKVFFTEIRGGRYVKIP